MDGLDISVTVAGLPPSAMVAGLLDLNGDRVPELIVLADRVQEAVGAGIDNVSSTSASWTMNANVENQAINGAGNVLANRMVGDAANNTLDGGAGVDTLIGNGGNDALIGGAGDDAMTGGSGNDTYNLDAAGDSVTEVRVDTGMAGYTRIPIDTDDVGIRNQGR